MTKDTLAVFTQVIGALVTVVSAGATAALAAPGDLPQQWVMICTVAVAMCGALLTYMGKRA